MRESYITSIKYLKKFDFILLYLQKIHLKWISTNFSDWILKYLLWKELKTLILTACFLFLLADFARCSYLFRGCRATHRAARGTSHSNSNKPQKYNNEGKWKRCRVSARWNNHHSLGRQKIDDNNRTYWRASNCLGAAPEWEWNWEQAG